MAGKQIWLRDEEREMVFQVLLKAASDLALVTIEDPMQRALTNWAAKVMADLAKKFTSGGEPELEK